KITSLQPAPAPAGSPVQVGLSNVYGPSAHDPVFTLRFDGTAMPLNPYINSHVGFTVPSGTTTGDHVVEVTDQPGLLEILSVVLLLRNRTDHKTLHVDSVATTSTG